MEIFEKDGRWVWERKPGVRKSFDTQEEAYEAAGMPLSSTPPLPEVREYDTLEEALKAEDDLDLYEEELIAEED